MYKMKNNLTGNRLFQVYPTLYFFFAEPPNFFFILGYTTKIITTIAPIIRLPNLGIGTAVLLIIFYLVMSNQKRKIEEIEAELGKIGGKRY